MLVGASKHCEWRKALGAASRSKQQWAADQCRRGQGIMPCLVTLRNLSRLVTLQSRPREAAQPSCRAHRVAKGLQWLHQAGHTLGRCRAVAAGGAVAIGGAIAWRGSRFRRGERIQDGRRREGWGQGGRGREDRQSWVQERWSQPAADSLWVWHFRVRVWR